MDRNRLPLAVVKSGKETGELTLTVKAKGLKTERIKLMVNDYK
ncbi:hypothetical protein [Bacteroides intestinalis]|nr:hypothetical protein [Bacteroides intestinalis]